MSLSLPRKIVQELLESHPCSHVDKHNGQLCTCVVQYDVTQEVHVAEFQVQFQNLQPLEQQSDFVRKFHQWVDL